MFGHYRSRFARALVVASALLIACTPAAVSGPTPTSTKFDEKAVADFYSGKTIRIISGLPPGTADVYARVLIRFMPQYIPGKPNMIVENKVGGGGLLAANEFYNLEPKDGTVISAFLEGNVLQQALGKEGVQFDAGKLHWLGALADDRGSCATRNDTGVKTIEDLMVPNSKQLIVAGIAPGTMSSDIPSLLKAALGVNFKVVNGFPGGPDSINAVLNKEADVYCASFTAMMTVAARIVGGEKPVGRFIAILGADRLDHPLLKDVPPAETLAKTDEARQMLKALGSPGKMSFPFALAPDAPSDRVAALRKAFDQTLADPAFKQEVIKLRGFDWPTRTADSVTQVVKDILGTPPAVLAKLKEALK